MFLRIVISIVDGDCSHEIKRRLLLGRKAMTNLDSILKSRDITLPIKVCRVKAVVFPVLMCGCESWTIKKAEHWIMWVPLNCGCWRRLLRVPWTARRSNQSILKEITPDYSLEGLMLKLKLQHFGHLMRRANSLEKPGRGWQRMGQLDGIATSMNMSLSQPPRDEGQWSLVCSSPWGYKESDVTERLKTNFHGNNFLLIEWKINYNFVNIWENKWTAFRKKIYFLIHMKQSVNFGPIFNQIYMLFTMFAILKIILTKLFLAFLA